MKRVVAVGEIMVRFSSPGFLRLGQCMPGKLEVLFAGAEASVAMSIAHLGAQATFVTALPEHAIADACVSTLRSVGVDTRHIVRTDQGRLGLYFLEAGANQRPSLVIYDREGSSVALTPPEAYDWDSIFADADWLVLSGITSAISPVGKELNRVAAEQASSRGVKILCDFNYRGKLWRWEPTLTPRELALRTIRELLPSLDLFVGGTDEICELLGQPQVPEAADGDPREAFSDVAARLCERFPRLGFVASTVRKAQSASRQRLGGMLWDAGAGAVHAAPGTVDRHAAWAELYDIEQMVDRIGTGDAFTAGLLFGLITPELAAPPRAIAFATAAFCLAHSVPGDFHFSTRKEIEALVAGDSSGRVQR